MQKLESRLSGQTCRKHSANIVMSFPVFTIDCFTSEQFKGNIAAVCPLEQDIPDDVKQKIAAEMKISVTGFISKKSSNGTFQDSTFGLQWFTPTTEIPLCGHGTLSAAIVLFQIYKNTQEEIFFETLSGTLVARKKEKMVVLDMPQNPPDFISHPQKVDPIIEAIVDDLPVQDICYSSRAKKLMIRLQDSCSQLDLERIRPDFSGLIDMGRGGLEGMIGVIVTVRGAEQNGYDFYSRFFAPWSGVNEDPVCGSAHTVLGPYWGRELGKDKMIAMQCSGRTGKLYITLKNNNRMDLAGEAIIMMQGHLRLNI